VLETIDSFGSFSSMTMDRAGHLHVAYVDTKEPDPTNDDLKYATNAGGSWVSRTLDTGDIWFATSIALDAFGRPAIVYREYTAGELRYISCR